MRRRELLGESPVCHETTVSGTVLAGMAVVAVLWMIWIL